MLKVLLPAGLRIRLLILLLPVLGRAEGAPASADSALALPDAMVTATRTTRRAVEVPRAVNRVGEVELAERMPRNSAEALREESGITVQKTEHGGGNAVIRGLGSNQVLLMVDGIRLNNSTYRFGNHPYLTTVDNHMLERLEVVRGPGSVLYGSDAMGGTVNLVTRSPSTGGESLSARGRAHARYASIDGEMVMRTDGAMTGKGFGVSVGATLRKTGDLRRGENFGHPYLERTGAIQGPSGYSGQDYDLKVAWAVAPEHSLTLAWQTTNRPEIPRFDRYENDGFQHWLYIDQNRDLSYLVYQGKESVPIRAFLSWQHQEEGREMLKTGSFNETREWGETTTFGAGIQADKTLGRHALTAGLDAYLDQVGSSREIVDVNTGVSRKQILSLYPDGSYHGTYGLFLQDEFRITPAWVATIGGRYNLFRLDYGVPLDPALAFHWGRVEEDFQSLTGSLSLSWQAFRGVYLHTSLAQGFRAPNLSDVAKTGESKGNVYEIPNRDLQAEEILSLDAGVKVDRGRVKAAVFVHHGSISNLMASAPTTYQGSPTYAHNGILYRLQSKQNIGEAFIRGVESEFKVRAWSMLWLRGNLAYTYGHNTTLDDPVGGIPPAVGLAGVRWADATFAVEGFTRFAGDQNRLSEDDRIDPRNQPGGTPGWATLNARGEWYQMKSIRIVLGLENLMDLNYREHGSGISAPGRNLTGGIDWAF